MNKTILMGRIVRDAEAHYAGDTAVAKFTLAVPRQYKTDESDFILCTGFGKKAEFFQRYGKKGTKFCIEGHIQTGSYTKDDGTKVYTTEVIVENAEFAESKQSQPVPTESAPVGVFHPIDNLDDEGLPFN